VGMMMEAVEMRKAQRTEDVEGAEAAQPQAGGGMDEVGFLGRCDNVSHESGGDDGRMAW
jgi:hypothetical protein